MIAEFSEFLFSLPPSLLPSFLHSIFEPFLEAGRVLATEDDKHALDLQNLRSDAKDN